MSELSVFTPSFKASSRRIYCLRRYIIDSGFIDGLIRFFKKQSSPKRQCKLRIERKRQVVWLVGLRHGCDALHEVAVQIISICAGDVGVIRVRKSGREQVTVGTSALNHGAVKSVCRPFADASGRVWCDVAGVNRAKRRADGFTSRKRRAATGCVAGGAVADFG